MRSAWGPIYRNAWMYRLTMACLREAGERAHMLHTIAQEIGPLSVLDLCSGTGDLNAHMPKNKYQGIDKNPYFVDYALQHRIPTLQGDVRMIQWPAAEALVMVDSLYHFLNDIDALLLKMTSSGFTRIVISEPVENVVNELPRWLRPLGLWATRVDDKDFPERFTDEALRTLLETHGFKRIFRLGHNLIGVWNRNG